jgi:hypothetical protein
MLTAIPLVIALYATLVPDVPDDARNQCHDAQSCDPNCSQTVLPFAVAHTAKYSELWRAEESQISGSQVKRDPPHLEATA